MQHHLEVATWNKGGKKKDSLQRRTEVATRRKEMGIKRGCDITMRSRHKIETYESEKTTNTIATKNQSHNMKSSYKQKSGRNIKLMSQLRSWKNRKTIMSGHLTEVATSTL